MSIKFFADFVNNTTTYKAFEKCLGKIISRIEICDEHLDIYFDTFAISISDEGQSCCEHRYMHTDDDLSFYAGAIFTNVELGDSKEDRDPEAFEHKDSQFLIISTNKGSFTIVNYNEHNGYYGGFYISARVRAL